MTLMTAFGANFSISSNISRPPQNFWFFDLCPVSDSCRTRVAGLPSCPGTPIPSGTDTPVGSKILRKPATHLLHDAADVADGRAHVTRAAARPRAVQQQSHAG